MGVRSLGGRTRRVPCHSHGQGADATRFRSLGPWFDGLDFGPGVGRPRQVRPLQGGRWLIACVSAVQQAQISPVTSVGGVPVSCSVPAVSVDGVVRPIPLSADSEHRLLTELKAYKATSVLRLSNRQGEPSLAVRVTFACETLPCRVKVGLQVFEVTHYAARVRWCTRCQKLNYTAKFCKQSIQICPRCGGRGHGKEGCSASPSCPNCSGPYSAAWLGCPEYRTRLLANKITNIHAVQSRNQTGQTDTIQQHRNQQTCTHNPTILIRGPAPKPTTNSNTQNSYLCKYC